MGNLESLFDGGASERYSLFAIGYLNRAELIGCLPCTSRMP